MTTITDLSVTFEIIAEGHAGSAGKGEDLVCCAISTLMYTLEEALQRFNIPTKVTLQDGFFRVCAFPSLESRGRADIIFKTIGSGLEHLSLQYPDNVKYLKKGEK